MFRIKACYLLYAFIITNLFFNTFYTHTVLVFISLNFFLFHNLAFEISKNVILGIATNVICIVMALVCSIVKAYYGIHSRVKNISLQGVFVIGMTLLPEGS